MLTGLAAAIGSGVIVAAITRMIGPLRIADKAPLSILVCVSGAVAGWATLRVTGHAAEHDLHLLDVGVPLLGAALVATEAWRGRRRTLTELRPPKPRS